MKTRYIRLLTYGIAMEIVNYANAIGGDCYAHVTVGGISIQSTDEEWEDIHTHIKGLGVRFEVSEDHPTKTTKKIVNSLKERGIIRSKDYGSASE